MPTLGPIYQQSPNAAARSTARSAKAPTQIGRLGFCSGLGEHDAPSRLEMAGFHRHGVFAPQPADRDEVLLEPPHPRAAGGAEGVEFEVLAR